MSSSSSTITTTTSTTTTNGRNNVEKPQSNPFALHKATCDGNAKEVKRLLDTYSYYREIIDVRDLHGYPATHYAVHLGHREILEILLKYGADPSKKSAAGWSCIQEAIARRDKELALYLLSIIKKKIDTEFHKRLPVMIQAISSIPDFEMELKWEFKSWVPLVSRFCPFDCYKIYKRGGSFRVDTTIVGFEGIRFQRGDLSLIFNDGKLYAVDNIKQAYSELSLLSNKQNIQEEEISIMMNGSINRAKIITEDIEITPAKSWFGHEKFEKIGDHGEWNSQVYDASDVDKLEKMIKTSINDIDFQIRESAIKHKFSKPKYFKVPDGFDAISHDMNLDKSKIKSQGLLCDGESVNEKHKYFKGTIWISKDFPRTISDLLPIFEVLSPTNKLFGRLRDFISLKLPAQGFPVKL
eukprot:gene7802-9603_t